MDRQTRRQRAATTTPPPLPACWPARESKGERPTAQTDEHGIQIVANPVHVHDYHATILHVMGIDHEHLTYRYAGRDFRLTDVHGHVVRDVLT